MAEPEPRIGVALSGGGYRAAAFAAGALLYLIDSGRAERITAISSVSGGSVTNAYFARNVLRAGEPPENVWDATAPLLAFLARRDILSPVRMLTFAMFLALPAGLFAGFIATARGSEASLAIPMTVLVAIAVFSLTEAALYMKLRRSLELAVEWLLQLPDAERPGLWPSPLRAAFRFFLATLPRPLRASEAVAPRLTPLEDISASYFPVFSCTDLATGSQLHISTSFVAGIAPSADRQSALLNLSGSAPALPVATAVAASAAFPLVFRPVEISTAALGLPARWGVVEERVALADGGLYDNFGVTALHAWRNREMDAAVLGDLGPPPDTVIVVDSGQSGYFRRRRPAFLRAVVRSMDVIHQANSISRRREIKRLFEAGLQHGTVVTVDDDPYQVAMQCEDETRRKSIEAWMEGTKEQHRLTRVGWRTLAQQRNPGIRTNLRGLGTTRVAELLIHGYVATMARTTAELGWSPASPACLPEDIAGVFKCSFVGSFWDRLGWVLSGGARRLKTGDAR